jgi:hypothetical protein
MAKRATSRPTSAGPVFLPEALERFLPRCDDNPHAVAERLDTLHRRGELCLLAGGVMVAPSSNPNMLGLVARNLVDGTPVLLVQVRQDLTGDYPIWDQATMESLKRHHEFWAFERAGFEAQLSMTVKRSGGRPRVYGPEAREQVLTEAAMVLFEEGPPNPLTEDGLADMVSIRMGAKSPGSTLLKEILKPLYDQLVKSMRQR